MSNPKISIITVVFNSEQLIERTVQSVVNQTYKNIEYIIIDGNSKDKTLSVIEQFKSKIAVLVSEPDKGLYDAMNKGLAIATGDYVCFLNSGDSLFSNTILDEAFGVLNYLPDVVYGETMIVDLAGNELGLRRLKTPEQLTWKSFKDGMLVCHQSVYIKRSITGEYDLRFRIAADYEWVLSALKKAQNIHNSHLILTRFLDGGMNKKNIRRGLQERLNVMINHYGLFPTVINHLVIGAKFLWFLFRNKRF